MEGESTVNFKVSENIHEGKHVNKQFPIKRYEKNNLRFTDRKEEKKNRCLLNESNYYKKFNRKCGKYNFNSYVNGNIKKDKNVNTGYHETKREDEICRNNNYNNEGLHKDITYRGIERGKETSGISEHFFQQHSNLYNESNRNDNKNDSRNDNRNDYRNIYDKLRKRQHYIKCADKDISHDKQYKKNIYDGDTDLQFSMNGIDNKEPYFNHNAEETEKEKEFTLKEKNGYNFSKNSYYNFRRNDYYNNKNFHDNVSYYNKKEEGRKFPNNGMNYSNNYQHTSNTYRYGKNKYSDKIYNAGLDYRNNYKRKGYKLNFSEKKKEHFEERNKNNYKVSTNLKNVPKETEKEGIGQIKIYSNGKIKTNEEYFTGEDANFAIESKKKKHGNRKRYN